MAREKPTGKTPGAARKPFNPDAGLDERARFLQPRPSDLYCRIHKIAVEATGWCPAAQAWWYPAFACPECGGPLWDNGYCATCTPATKTFPGDYFEQRWDAESGREYGHYVRVYKGPTAAPSREQAMDYITQLKALVSTTADAMDANGLGISRRLRGCRCDRCVAHFAAAREPGDESGLVD